MALSRLPIILFFLYDTFLFLFFVALSVCIFLLGLCGSKSLLANENGVGVIILVFGPVNVFN